MSRMETTCRKCGGTGRHPSRVEGGRCFACTGRADTSYTRNIKELTDEEAAAAWAAHTAEAKASRRARKEAR